MAHGMNELSELEAEERYGLQVAQNATSVVRAKREADGTIKVFVHKKDSLGELRPLAYLVGVNYMEVKP